MVQPPSGGCVLKHDKSYRQGSAVFPAAFGRLCVETLCHDEYAATVSPAAFGRLCVETLLPAYNQLTSFQPPSGGCVLKQAEVGRTGRAGDPAAFGRLCVETVKPFLSGVLSLPAAFGRLCVETRQRL